MAKYAEQKAAYYQANKERIRERRKQFYQENKERLLAKTAEWHALNPGYQKKYALENKERQREWAKQWRANSPEKAYARQERWKAKNAHKLNAYSSARRAKVSDAKPIWYDEFLVLEIYDLAILRTKATGVKWEVDHIIPLNSKIVCGLHCHQNMRVVTKGENRRKNNRYWPDMP